MKIFIGGDHRGFRLKKKIIKLLQDWGHQTIDLGVHEEGIICDYPQIAYKVARKVAAQKQGRGILVCLTGIGHCIAANKIPGAYAALCYNKRAAALSREHNNANILVLGAKFVKPSQMTAVIKTWLNSRFAGGRHARRVNQIKRIERQHCKG